jgi:acyl carrier protein
MLSRLKHLIAELFRLDILEPDKIDNRERLIGGRLGLDSLDVLELALCVEEVFGVTIYNPDGALRTFASVGSLADFIRAHTQTRQAHRQSALDVRIALQVLTSPHRLGKAAFLLVLSLGSFSTAVPLKAAGCGPRFCERSLWRDNNTAQSPNVSTDIGSRYKEGYFDSDRAERLRKAGSGKYAGAV